MLVRVEFTDGGVEYLEFDQGVIPPRGGLTYQVVFADEAEATPEPGTILGVNEPDRLPDGVAPIPAKWSFTFEIEARGVRRDRRAPWNQVEGNGEPYFR